MARQLSPSPQSAVRSPQSARQGICGMTHATTTKLFGHATQCCNKFRQQPTVAAAAAAARSVCLKPDGRTAGQWDGADHVTCADIKCGPKDTCLVDLQTHLPRCVSCRYKCARKQQRTPFRADKICGYNNHTYNSWCEMRKDSCATGFFIGVRSTGVC